MIRSPASPFWSGRVAVKERLVNLFQLAAAKLPIVPNAGARKNSDDPTTTDATDEEDDVHGRLDTDQDDENDSDNDDDDENNNNSASRSGPQPSTSHLKDDYPSDQIQSLQDRHDELAQPLPILATIPTGCGILLNLQLVGIFPTARWLSDPTMPPDVKEMFGGTPFFALGDYRVAHLDLQDASGTLRPLTLVINSGVKGMKTGYWGGAFCRTKPHGCIARFETTGDAETTIVQRRPILLESSPLPEEEEEESVPPLTASVTDSTNTLSTTSTSTLGSLSGTSDSSSSSATASRFFTEYKVLEFVAPKFQGGIAPGICQTQLEKLLGVAVEFILTEADWNVLPSHLVEIRDFSPRAERKKSRQRPRLEKETSSTRVISSTSCCSSSDTLTTTTGATSTTSKVFSFEGVSEGVDKGALNSLQQPQFESFPPEFVAPE
jgi:hypothetical protein